MCPWAGAFAPWACLLPTQMGDVRLAGVRGAGWGSSGVCGAPAPPPSAVCPTVQERDGALRGRPLLVTHRPGLQAPPQRSLGPWGCGCNARPDHCGPTAHRPHCAHWQGQHPDTGVICWCLRRPPAVLWKQHWPQGPALDARPPPPGGSGAGTMQVETGGLGFKLMEVMSTLLRARCRDTASGHRRSGGGPAWDPGWKESPLPAGLRPQSPEEAVTFRVPLSPPAILPRK